MIKTYGVKQAAELLDINRRTIYNWIKSGKIKHTLKNGKLCISKEEVDALIRELGYGKRNKY